MKKKNDSELERQRANRQRGPLLLLLLLPRHNKPSIIDCRRTVVKLDQLESCTLSRQLWDSTTTTVKVLAFQTQTAKGNPEPSEGSSGDRVLTP